MKIRHMNKAISLLLALILMIPVAALPTMITVGASPATVTISDAELVADNYDFLTDGEKAFLKSAVVESESETIPAPSSSDLITVDPAAKTVVIDPYNDGNVLWYVDVARVVAGSFVEEIDPITGAFTYDGASYTVEADYVLDSSVDADVQKKLLNCGYNLAKAIEYMDTIADNDANFYSVSGNIDSFYSLTDGSLPGGRKLDSQDTIDAIVRVKEQADRNGGFFDLDDTIQDYVAAASKSQFLFERGLNYRTMAVGAYNDVKTIRNDPQINTLLTQVVGSTTSDGRKMRIALTAIDTLLAQLEEAMTNDWSILDPAYNAISANASYADIDAYLAGLAGAEDHSAEALKNALQTAPVTVSKNVSQYDVTVKLQAYYVAPGTVDDATLTALDEYTATIRLPEGTSAADVEAAVAANGIENNAITWWAVIDPAYFDRTVSALPAALSSDTEYVIAYSPKTVNVTYGFQTDLPTSVPVGYKLTLPDHEDAALVYDYMVENTQYLQGDVLYIDHDIEITRSAGKPWDVARLGEIVADVYAADLTPEQQAVLDSAALRTQNVLLREPANEDKLVKVLTVAGGFRVEAEVYRTGIQGVDWIPESGVAVKDGAVVAQFAINSGVGTFDTVDFDQVEVLYRTVLTNIPDTAVLQTLNLPSELADEAEAQIADLNLLNTIYSKLGRLDRPTLNQIKLGINGSDMGQPAKDAVNTILGACVDNTSASLKLYNYLTSYNETGLAYYYQDNNQLKMKDQAAILHENLGVILADPAFIPLLKDVKGEDEYLDFYQKVVDIYDVLGAVTLPGLNDAIDVSSTALADLAEKIEAAIGNAPRFSVPSGQLTLTKTLTAAAPNRVSVNVKVTLRDSRGTDLKSATGAVTFPAGSQVTTAMIAAVNAKIDELAAGLNIDTVHYGATREIGLSEGTVLSGDDVSASAVFAPNAYTCVVRDENDVDVDYLVFYYDDMRVTLPASANSVEVYRYTFDGVSYRVGTEALVVPITAAQFADGSYGIIRRETLDTDSEYLLSLVEEINKGIADGGMLDGINLAFALIPMQDAQGNWTIVFRMSPKALSAAKKSAINVAEAFTKSSFEYITLGGEAIRDGSDISIQAVINALLNSNADLNTIKNAINADGSLNEMAPIAGATVIGEVYEDGQYMIKVGSKKIKDTNILGAKLLEFDMVFAQSANAAGKNVKLYVTLEDFGTSADRLKKVRKAVNKVSKYGTVIAHNGMIDVDVTLPEKVFQAYLAATELFEGFELGSLESVTDVDRLLDFADQVLDFLENDKTIDLDTFMNTAEKAGKSIDLSAFDGYYSKAVKAARNILNNSTIQLTASAGTYDASIHYDIEALFRKLNIADTLKNLVKEKDTGLDGRVYVKINNSAAAYEAIIIDSKAPKADKILYSKDLATDITKIHDKSIVILLKDITADLAIPAAANLDLNGKTINGNVSAAKATKILDSSYATDSGAGITGTLSGNLKISGGRYNADVSAFLRTGFEQKDGLVRNKNYYILVDPADGTVLVHVDKKTEAATSAVSKMIAREIAMDQAFHTYAGAKMTIGGFNIYDFSIDDVTDLVGGVDADTKAEIRDGLKKANINALAADILAAVEAYADEAHDMVPGEVLTTYGVNYNPWAFELKHVTRGNYLSAKIMADTTRTVDAGSITIMGHNYEEVGRDEPQCEVDGTIYYECADCGATYEEPIDALGHDYQESDRVESTCIVPGHITYTCTRCGDSYDEALDLGPHTPADNWEITRPASETEKGLKVLKCSVCGAILEEQEFDYDPTAPNVQLIISTYRLASGMIDNTTRTINVVTKPDQTMAVFQLKLAGAGNDIFSWTDDSFANGCELQIKGTWYSAQTDAKGIRYFMIPYQGSNSRTETLTVTYQGMVYTYTVNVTFAQNTTYRDGVVPGWNADKDQTGFEPGRNDLIYLVSLPGKTQATYRLNLPVGATVRVISANTPHLFQTDNIQGTSYHETTRDNIDDNLFVYFKSFKSEGIDEYDLRVTYKDSTTQDIHVIVQWN